VAEVSLCFELGRATVVVNEDQLSLAIGKRGQNVRLAARLTGWDVDILTPVEFQNGVQRLDATLKSIEGFPQDQVDKVIALGLIDVRDILEVGAGPLMEELGIEESVAEAAVLKCESEAKIVAIETEKKKAEAARAKATGSGPNDLAALMGLKGVDGVAGQPAGPRAIQEGMADTIEAAIAEGGLDGADRMPGALESSDGGAPEVTVHSEKAFRDGQSDLSPEEEAMHVTTDGPSDGERRVKSDEDDAAAALAEGRVEPPVTGREGAD
jgi:N utilization substance protein A